MGKPMMIQEEDDKRIERLKKKLNSKTKVDVLRSALSLLENHFMEMEREELLTKAVKAVIEDQSADDFEFQKNKKIAEN